MAAPLVLLNFHEKTGTTDPYITATVTPHTGGVQLILVGLTGSGSSEATPVVTVNSGLTGQGAITATSPAGIGGAASQVGLWMFWVTSNPGTVVAGTYSINFAAAPTAFAVTIIEYQAGDWNPALNPPVTNVQVSTISSAAKTNTFSPAPATTSRCGSYMVSRNRVTGALTAGTSPWAALSGAEDHETVAPSASTLVQDRTASTSTLADGGNWGTVANCLGSWEIPIPPAVVAQSAWGIAM